MLKSAGGLLVAIAGVGVLIMGLNGTWEDVWRALVKSGGGGGNGDRPADSPPAIPPRGSRTDPPPILPGQTVPRPGGGTWTAPGNRAMPVPPPGNPGSPVTTS